MVSNKCSVVKESRKLGGFPIRGYWVCGKPTLNIASRSCFE